MFLVGLEVDPGILRRSAKSALLASLIVPFDCGAILAQALFSRLGAGAPRLAFVLFFGAAMGITAFPALARILAERHFVRRGKRCGRLVPARCNHGDR